MLAADTPRPAKLYHYADRAMLERALALGQFHLQPAQPGAVAPPSSGNPILPFRRTLGATGAAGFLTLRLHQVWDEALFAATPGADCCLIIHDTEAFGERIHRAAQRVLPNWSGIDAPISYGKPSPLGTLFSKARELALQREWLFAWRPIQPLQAMPGVIISVGAIEAIAELRGKFN